MRMYFLQKKKSPHTVLLLFTVDAAVKASDNVKSLSDNLTMKF